MLEFYMYDVIQKEITIITVVKKGTKKKYIPSDLENII